MHIEEKTFLGPVYRNLTVLFKLDFRHFYLIQVLQSVVIWRKAHIYQKPSCLKVTS